MADVASLVFDIDASGADGAARALAGLNRYAAATATATAKLEKQFRGANGQFISYTEAVARSEAEIRSLAASYNPVLSAQLRFAEQQKEIARAVQLGVISVDQQANALRTLQVAYNQQIAGGARLTKGMGNMTHHVQNAGYQVGDFFVQVASGQNPMMALSQQLPQLLGGFGAIGAVAGGAVAILGAAWMIFADGATAAEKLAEALDSIDKSLGELDRLNQSLSTAGVERLREEYGEVNAELRAMLEAQRTLAQMDAMEGLQTALQALFENTDNSWYEFIYRAETGNARVQNLADTLSITRDQASAMYAAMREAMSADGAEAQVAALGRLRAEAAQILATNTMLTAEQRQILGAIVDSEEAARKLLATSGNLPGVFGAAAAAAGKITDELNRAVNAASRLAASALSDVRFAQIELDFRTDEVGKAAAIAAAKFDAEVGKADMDQWLYNSLRQQAIDGATETARIMAEVGRLNDADRAAEKESGGGGDAKIAAAERQFQSLQQLMQKETIFQFAEYEKRYAQLVGALELERITKEQYALMDQQLRTLYFGGEFAQRQVEYDMSLEQLRMALERDYITREQYQQRISQLNAQKQNEQLSGYSTFFGNMASAAQAGGNKTTAAVRAFSVAQGLLNSYLAYTQVLADPALIGRPFLRTALAASTLASGLAQVANMGGGGGGAGGVSSSATQAAPVKPQNTTLIRIDGDRWANDFLGSLLGEIYNQSKDGKVIIAGYNG